MTTEVDATLAADPNAAGPSSAAPASASDSQIPVIEDSQISITATSSAQGTAAAGELFARGPGEAAIPEAARPKQTDEEELAAAAHDDIQLLAEAARFAAPERVRQVLEALLFAAEKPLDLPGLMEATQFSQEQVTQGLATLSREYLARKGGIALADLGGRWQLRTEPAVGAYVRRMLQVKPLRLTRAAMETLAIIAYRQPLTRPEMEDIRGVDCGAVTKALLERKLVRILGKKDEPGRPLLYGTSKEFLELFNLRDLTQLPTLREFQELSEESRKIVEEETPDAPAVAGLTELAHDPSLEAKMKEAAQESDAALLQLEKAMEVADVHAKSTAAVLDPPPSHTADSQIVVNESAKDSITGSSADAPKPVGSKGA